MSTPKVTICIPTRNFARFLTEAVRSALAQTFDEMEVLIVDNCSTDNTESLVRAFASSDSRIQYHRNEQDIGLVGNLNRCLQLARGEYIKYLLADDLLLPECVRAMVGVLDADPTVTLVTGGQIMVDEPGNIIGTRQYSQRPLTMTGTDAIQRCLFASNYIGAPTAVMFRRRDAVRGFRDDYPQLTDMEMWFHLLERGRLASLAEPVCMIRTHGEQLTNANIRSGRLVDDNVRLFEEFQRKPYVQLTHWNVFRHKLRMSYRIWISRHSLTEERRKFLLRRYASWLAYYGMMPVVVAAMRCAAILRQLMPNRICRLNSDKPHD